MTFEPLPFGLESNALAIAPMVLFFGAIMVLVTYLFDIRMLRRIKASLVIYRWQRKQRVRRHGERLELVS